MAQNIGIVTVDNQLAYEIEMLLAQNYSVNPERIFICIYPAKPEAGKNWNINQRNLPTNETEIIVEKNDAMDVIEKFIENNNIDFCFLDDRYQVDEKEKFTIPGIEIHRFKGIYTVDDNDIKNCIKERLS